VTLPEEALYPTAVVDSSGALLDGRSRYRLRFPPQQLPPAGAFWSVTVYGSDGGGLRDNEIARHSIGDRTPGLALGHDGSLTLRVQHDRPPDGLAANWLPVPEGGFHLIMRVYVPHPRALTGEWGPPPVERVTHGDR